MGLQSCTSKKCRLYTFIETKVSFVTFRICFGFILSVHAAKVNALVNISGKVNRGHFTPVFIVVFQNK